MQHRRFGRTGWEVGEVGYGMWGMGGQWEAVDDDESLRSLERAVELGVDFFDTAWAYGDGRSERLLGELVARHGERKLYAATKIPPKNREWPSKRNSKLEDVFPPEWRGTYFVPENLRSSVEHTDALKPLVSEGMTMPEMALRFILSNPAVSTVIPGMRKLRNVESNVGMSDGEGLPTDLLARLEEHRWDRQPTEWSQ